LVYKVNGRLITEEWPGPTLSWDWAADSCQLPGSTPVAVRGVKIALAVERKGWLGVSWHIKEQNFSSNAGPDFQLAGRFDGRAIAGGQFRAVEGDISPYDL